MLKLTELPQQYVEKYGKDKVAEICGQPLAVISMWLSKRSFPLAAMEALLAFDPAPIHAVNPLYTEENRKAKLALLLPSLGGLSGPTVETVIRLYNPQEMTVKRMGFNTLSFVRNSLAAWFLSQDIEWAFWIDSDMVLPAGDAKWFKDTTKLDAIPDVFCGVNSILRMLHHRKKLIGCTYFAKRDMGDAQFAGGHDQLLVNGLRSRPRDEIRPVDWIGFGGVLTHRDVFLDIIKTQGDEIKVTDAGIKRRFGYDYAFFDNIPGWTEDTSFCVRAKKAGHQPYVDFSVRAAHVGEHCY